MTQEHPITPPNELVQEWINKHYGGKVHRELGGVERTIATQSARWGADMELDACCEWVGAISGKYGPRLRLARRPNPPSLKEQALDSWDRLRNEAWCEEIDFDAEPEPDRLTVQEISNLPRHWDNYIAEDLDGEIQLDGHFSRADLQQLASSIPNTHD